MTNKLLIPLILLGALATGAAPSLASTGDWTPRASDRLMKLPGSFLKKAVDNDFAKSGLAAEMVKTDERVSLKKDSLADLQAAIETTDGDTRLDLEYQFLTEKKRYLGLMREQQDMRRRRAVTKVRLYERILKKMNTKQSAATPSQARLVENQNAARERFDASLSSIDTKLFQSSVTEGSKYGREYAKNVAAIDKLVQAISAHPMNRAPELNGQPVTQADYLRQLIAENESEIALVDQERSILGFMAKLVSLDALALSEGVTDTAVIADASAEPDHSAAAAIDFFMTR